MLRRSLENLGDFYVLFRNLFAKMWEPALNPGFFVESLRLEGASTMHHQGPLEEKQNSGSRRHSMSFCCSFF